MRQLTFLHLGFALCIMLVSISYTSSGKMTSKAGIQKNGPGADYLQHCFQTLYPSYAIKNHGFYHPSYQMVAGMSVGDSYLMAQIINPKVAKELKLFAEHNVENVWQFLKGIIHETGDLAFPSGLDWSLNIAYLQNETGGFPNARGSEVKNYIAHYSDAGLIVQRSKNALTTISYGQKTMALVYPLKGTTASQQFLISPNTSSFIGPVGKSKLKSFKQTTSGFRVELNLKSNTGRESRMIIESTPDAVVFLEY